RGNGNKTAIVFENEEGSARTISYQELLDLTGSIATMLYDRDIRQGDRVAIYLPMIPEAIASMLACARIGAIHTVVFGGFSEEALSDRIFDAQAKAVITAESGQRKGHALRLRKTVEQALRQEKCASVTTVLCFGLAAEKAGSKIIPYERQTLWPEEVTKPLAFDAEHPLFILYTSGTTGKPKGLFHATGGYLAQVVATTQWVFDLRDEDLFWCTADVGWITGHSYLAYGPLALGKSVFVYEGALNWPDSRRIYQLIDKHGITVLYTAPTAIRMFMQAGDAHAQEFALSTIRLLGSVGEPINPEAWQWYRRVFGKNRCEVVDSWWQTETGAMMIVPIEHISAQKPGSASQAFMGISVSVVDDRGEKVKSNSAGYLVIDKPWPSLARGIWGDQERFFDTYFRKFSDVYFTGDGAKIDGDGDFFISGRIDDVVNVAGHRLGTAEVESALVAHVSVAEAAVVGVRDEVTGQKLVAFVVLINGFTASSDLSEQLRDHVKTMIGSFAKPAAVHFATTLPKTRSGKIMRRLLRAKVSGQAVTTDVSTLDDTTSS
ncbi:MAG TPA: acetate--CoA ligase, partial [Myxococcota bacterium]|nr:acetate--CoA ligase [Myxococcota bacterium]